MLCKRYFIFFSHEPQLIASVPAYLTNSRNKSKRPLDAEKSIVLRKTKVNDHDLDYRAKQIANWISTGKSSEFLLKPRRGFSEDDQKLIQHIEKYTKNAVEESVHQKVNVKIVKNDQMLRMLFQGLAKPIDD